MLQGWPKMLFIGLSCYFEANFEIIPVWYFLVYFLSVIFSTLFQLCKQGSYFLKIMLLVYIVAPIVSILSCTKLQKWCVYVWLLPYETTKKLFSVQSCTSGVYVWRLPHETKK